MTWLCLSALQKMITIQVRIIVGPKLPALHLTGTTHFLSCSTTAAGRTYGIDIGLVVG
jgi:hypothetical protein